jgi:beta-N-acetylhexosaminidase
MSTAHTPAGRVLMVDIEGKRLDDETAAYLREHCIRAVCLFRKNLGTEAEICRLTADLRAAMGPGALIAMDQEGGSVVRALCLPQAPGAMALGAAGHGVAGETLATQVGAAVARGLRHLGINWNFAPVVDVNNNPANPVIAERSFGADADDVTRLARAWMRGATAEGVACCLKHFPGHGDTHTDSHHALPVVDKPLAELQALELVPFTAMAGEAPSLMTAHIVYPQIDPEHPATLSRKLLTGLLREGLGYRGVVITDALMMRAVHERYGHARAAVLALQAGADMPFAQGSRQEQLDALCAIQAAQADGSLAAEVMAQAAARLDLLATNFPAMPRTLTPAQREADETLMRTGWARALTAIGAPQTPARHTPLRVVTQDRVDSDGVSEAGLPGAAVRALFEGFADVEFVAVASLTALDASALRAPGRFTVLVSNQRPRYASPGTLRPDLHLVLWNPYQVLDVHAPAIVTWGHAQGALAALRDWLHGLADAPGRAPVRLT